MTDLDAKAIHLFATTARPIMRRWMPANSCIGAAKTTLETMKLLGLRARVLPVSLLFQVPSRKYVRICGFSAEEKAEMRARSADWIDEGGEGWSGHLLVLVDDHWLLDPSIDQVSAPRFGVYVEPEVFVWDTGGQTWTPDVPFEMRLGIGLTTGETGSIYYQSFADESFLKTEAWNDEGLPFLAWEIFHQMIVSSRLSLGWRGGQETTTT
jgi:hypothetical protein